VQAWRGLFEEVKRLDQCVSLKQLALTGADLIRVGYKPGKELGEKLEFLLQKVLEDPELNTQEKLLNILSEASS
jgi:tRNA nucleotidyltransferase (CCA-adding enzyme)